MQTVIIALAFAAVATASNPFSSNVIALTPKNFKQLENSPHTWFVNVCRQSWGYCGRLTPEWVRRRFWSCVVFAIHLIGSVLNLCRLTLFFVVFYCVSSSLSSPSLFLLSSFPLLLSFFAGGSGKINERHGQDCLLGHWTRCKPTVTHWTNQRYTHNQTF